MGTESRSGPRENGPTRNASPLWRGVVKFFGQPRDWFRRDRTFDSEPKPTKLSRLGQSAILWGGIGLLIGAIASPYTMKYLFVLGSFVCVFEVWRVSSFEHVVGKLVVSVLLISVLSLIWHIVPKPKEAPSLDQEMDAFAKHFPWLSQKPEPMSSALDAVE